MMACKKSAERIYVRTDTEIRGLDTDAKKGVVAIHKFAGEYNGFLIEAIIRDKGSKQFLYEIKFIEKQKSSQQSMADKTASPAPIGDAENIPIISDVASKSNTFAENISKDAAILNENENSAEKVGAETEDRAENVHEEVEDAAENVTNKPL